MKMAAPKLFAFAASIPLFLVLGVGGRTWEGDPPVKADRFGDPLPKDVTCPHQGHVRFRVEGYVAAVVFIAQTANGWRPAIPSGLAYLWEADTGKVIRHIRHEANDSPDSVLLSSTENRSASRTPLEIIPALG